MQGMKRDRDTPEECAKRIRTAIYGEEDVNKRAKAIADETGIDVVQFKVEPLSGNNWLYKYKGNEFTSITRLVDYLFSYDDETEDEEQSNRTHRVCARFNTYLQKNKVDNIPNEDELIRLIRLFAREDWMTVYGNKLSEIRDAYPTLKTIYIDENFDEAVGV